MTGRTMRFVVAAMMPAASVIIVTAAPQGDASAKKANIAVSGCLLRQGYATLVISGGLVDGKGDAAATAPPTTVTPGAPLTAPPRWILDNAGPLAPHVGEHVQILGISDWVSNPADYPIPTGEPGPPPPSPHIEVIAMKVVAQACS